MQWIVSHVPLLLTCLLALSETAAVICQLAFPNNQGASGIIAGIIKFLQSLGAQEPPKAG